MPRLRIFACLFGLSCSQAAQKEVGTRPADISRPDAQARGDSGQQSDSSPRAPNGIGLDLFDSGEIVVANDALGKDWRFFRGEGWANCSLPIPPGFAVKPGPAV